MTMWKDTINANNSYFINESECTCEFQDFIIQCPVLIHFVSLTCLLHDLNEKKILIASNYNLLNKKKI